MATLDPFYDLFEFDSSETILGLKQTKTNDHLIITTTTTVAVFEILTRKVTRSFTLNQNSKFTSAAIVSEATNSTTDAAGTNITTDAAAAHLYAAVEGNCIWRWRLDAADLRSDVTKIPVDFDVEELTKVGDGVDEEVFLIGRRGEFRRCDDELLQQQQQQQQEQDELISTSKFVNGRWASLTKDRASGNFSVQFFSPDSDSATPRFRLPVEDAALIHAYTPVVETTPTHIYLRQLSFCISWSDGTLTEFRLPSEETRALDSLRIRQSKLDCKRLLLLVDPEREMAFQRVPGESVMMTSLRFGTVLASQPLKDGRHSGVCLVVDSTFYLVVDGYKVLAFPFAFTDVGSTLSFNFGRSAKTSEEGEACWRKMSLPSNLPKYVDCLRANPVNQAYLEEALTGDQLTQMERNSLLTALIEKVSKESTFWPEALLRKFLKAAVVTCHSGPGTSTVWHDLIQSIIKRKKTQFLMVVLNQEGIPSKELCMMLKFVLGSEEDVTADTAHATAIDAADADVTDAGDAVVASPLPQVHQEVLIRLLTYSFRENDMRSSLRQLAKPEVHKFMKFLLHLLSLPPSTSTSLPSKKSIKITKKSILWANLLIDSHFTEMVMSDDVDQLETLARLREFTNDLDLFFETVGSLKPVLKEWRKKHGDRGYRTVMEEGEEYCIQVMEF